MLDLQKAFDTVDHDILCRKLRAMGVESVEWFRSYLADRTQSVHAVCCSVPVKYKQAVVTVPSEAILQLSFLA
ncbi:hypothetical protein DPMN_105057 [Dreissena polymorpha]|uniref:Reverse transcriptase domain-containing protein n=1 Tax=Dreissena polymorpha TaxID=45954 RepID=A0A9D4K2Z3_DREPO|nr:hypothetical protein DPMN_105057 [Dreissena polymorpha]